MTSLKSRRRINAWKWDLIVWSIALLLTVLSVASCASCPPCKSCPKCNAALQSCEQDLSTCIDLATRCNKE